MIKECNICGSKAVEVVSNELIYGKVYGNGKAFMCMDCKSFVGCHADGKPFGILANQKMRDLRKECHSLFDPVWKERKLTRSHAYAKLAIEMGIPKSQCHFGMFDINKLNNALTVLRKWKWK